MESENREPCMDTDMDTISFLVKTFRLHSTTTTEQRAVDGSRESAQRTEKVLIQLILNPEVRLCIFRTAVNRNPCFELSIYLQRYNLCTYTYT